MLPITLQVCASVAQYPQLAFTASNNGPIKTGAGLCARFASGALVADACGASPDTFSWAADGTVKSAATGSCLNVNGAGMDAGTTIIAYECGVATVAANDVFSYDVAAQRILANESALCLATANVPPPPPPPPGTCASALDCNLNGECVAGKCACYKPWTAAPDCSALAFLPSPVVRGFPPPNHNETTWGGSIVQDPASGEYHMFVAEMMNECPLNTWGQNSRCTHAVSATPEGPYATADVAVQNWCHNPAIILTTDAVTKAPLWMLFHIGTGTGGSTKNCSAGADADVARSGAPAAGGSTLHTAPGPTGPWTPADSSFGACNNPAPFLARNGSIFLVCDGFKLMRGDNATAGGAAWTTVVHITATGQRIAGAYEDPFLYVDNRNNFHILYHVYRTGPIGGDAHNCLPGHDGAVVSGHYYSPDGLNWFTSPTMPYGNVITLADGTQQLVTTRERPKMLFNAAGEPTHLSNGVCPSPGGFNTPFSCPTVSTGCVDCKYDDWDFTNVSPLSYL